MIFKNRDHAGTVLAQQLTTWKTQNPVVLGLVRGGVPVAFSIAKFLDAPLDVILVRKLALQDHPEYAVGAIAEDGSLWMNRGALSAIRPSEPEIASAIEQEERTLRRQQSIFRKDLKPIDLKGRSVILVDDGLATGSTMLAAIASVKARGAGRIAVAVPVEPRSTIKKVSTEVDWMIVASTVDGFNSVSQCYEEFLQVTDEEVIEFLNLGRGNKYFLNSTEVEIDADGQNLNGELAHPTKPKGWVIFAHGSGSSRKSPRNLKVAGKLNDAGFGTLLIDLLSEKESNDRTKVFDINLLAERLAKATQWLKNRREWSQLPIGYFGASTGAAAALQCCAEFHQDVAAIVSRGGRPDLADIHLSRIKSPTLLIVGSEDRAVLKVNQIAHEKLRHSKIELIPGATHLFDEPGALDQVTSLAERWFSEYLAHSSRRLRRYENVISAIQSQARGLNDEGLGLIAEAIQDKKVVMLGESTHGTSEFYRYRARLSELLIRRHGFSFVAAEENWPDGTTIRRYIQGIEGNTARETLKKIHSWPKWMWANEEMAEFSEMLKATKTPFYGLDVYSLFESINSVLHYLKKLDPRMAETFAERYDCFKDFRGDEALYAKSLIHAPDGCVSEAIRNLEDLLKIKLSSAQADGEDLFNAQQNARNIRNSESFYRAMLQGGTVSWNVRDQHMADTLNLLLERHGTNSKAIVWAHNSHIGDYQATNLGSRGYVNLGGLARQRYGKDHVALIGFSTNEGKVMAAPAWGSMEQEMTLPPAINDTLEECFHIAMQRPGPHDCYLMLDEVNRKGPFSEVLGHRAVGVIYDSNHERRTQYVPTKLAERYDGFIFIDKTTAVHSIVHDHSLAGEIPETWPMAQ